jgi:hypothetical protein
MPWRPNKHRSDSNGGTIGLTVGLANREQYAPGPLENAVFGKRIVFFGKPTPFFEKPTTLFGKPTTLFGKPPH